MASDNAKYDALMKVLKIEKAIVNLKVAGAEAIENRCD